MKTNTSGRWTRNAGRLAVLMLASAIAGQAQSVPAGDSQGNSAAGGAEMERLAEAVRRLQETLRELQGQVELLQREREQTRAELDELRNSKGESGARAENTASDPGAPAAYPTAATVNLAEWSQAGTEALDTGERVARLEEAQGLAEARIAEHNQTKVESGSKYRVRLSGMVLLNLFSNRGSTDSIDIPQIATAPNSVLGSPGTWGGTLRQSQIGLEAFGPELAGARSSASVRFDFAGGFPYHQNGATEGLVRLRTGTIRLDWKNTSLIAGQDALFFVPLSPTSLATVAAPALSYAGNLWAWTPQVRAERRVTLAENTTLSLAAGILDPLSGEIPEDWNGRQPSWGEQSRHPAFAGRIGVRQRIGGQEVSIGAGSFVGSENWGQNRSLKNIAGTVDFSAGLGRFLGISGFFYRGQNVAGLGGGIGQGVLWRGSIMDPATVFHGLNTEGGWAQVKFTPRAKFEVNGGYGQDNPFASQLRRYGPNGSYYGALLSRNQSPYANFLYRVRSDVMFSMEYRYLKTTFLDAGSKTLHHVNAAVAYTF